MAGLAVLSNLSSTGTNNLQILENCKAEPSLAKAIVGQGFQFERQGYFCLDSKYSTQEKLVFNRTISLKDSFAKTEEQE